MIVFAFFISLVFAIVFPILISNKAYTITYQSGNPTSSNSNSGAYSTIHNFFNINGAYFFLFIALVITSIILIAVAKNKTTKFVSYGIVLISFSYFINVFTIIYKNLKEYALSLPNTAKISISASSIILLALFIIILLNCSIILLATTLPKKPNEQNQVETI